MTIRDEVRKKASKCDLTSNQAEAKNITLMDLCACHGILYRMKAYILLQTALLPPPPPPSQSFRCPSKTFVCQKDGRLS